MRGNAPILLFEAAKLLLGVFVAEVSGLFVEGEVAPVPFCGRALLGLCRDEGGTLMPVFSLAAFAEEGTDTMRAGAQVAVFGSGRGPIGLRMDAMRGVRQEYRYLARRADAELHRQKLAAGLQGILDQVGELDDGQVFYFFSPEAFLAAVAADSGFETPLRRGVS